MQKFEILDKDVMGRICRIETPSGTFETPALLPVVNPNIPLIDASEMRKFGAEAIITNAYILYRTAKQEVEEKGLHRFLNVDIPVMTDSGSYQLMVYGDVEVTNREIVEFQERIGADIVVPLDIPTPPDSERDTAEEDLEKTLQREKEARDIISRSLLALPIQGSTFTDLRRRSAEAVKKIGGDVYPIGAVVPLLDSYRFLDLARIILEVRSVIRVEPIHLFGCGHPMVFSMAVAMGCDIFDSAAYALYAKDDRYMTIYGTKKLVDLHYFPCSCPVCTRYTPEEMKEMNKKERERLIAEHNLYVSFQEIKTIKQAIKEGSLFELVEKRIRSHPYLLAGWRLIKDYSKHLELFDPKIKKKFLYCGVESIYRPSVMRHVEAVKNIEFGEEVVVSSDFGILAEIYLRPVFGPVPAELMESFPAGHAEIPPEDLIEDEAIIQAVENLKKLMNEKKDVKFKIYVSKRWEKYMKELPENGELHVLSRET
ncbi:MAG: tRNA guanosine(15) transglycosylase TgtA [Archaeoglobaceae archaeon]